MTNLNKVLLIGRLGKDPELRYTKDGGAVANFSIATSEYWKDKGGNKQEKTEWHNIVVWGKQADFAEKYLKKGSLVYLEGRLQTRDWTDKENVKRYTTEIVAHDIKFMEKRGEGEAPATGGQQQSQNNPPSQPQDGGDEAYLEDDIPF